MNKDIILERSEIGLCPICNLPLPLEIKKINYKIKEIRICRHHFVQGKENEEK